MEPVVINIHLSSTLTAYTIGRRIFDLHSGSDLYRVPIFQLLLGTYRKYPVCCFPTAFLVFPFLFSCLSFPPRWSFPSPHFLSNGQNTSQLLFLYTDEFLPNWLICSAPTMIFLKVFYSTSFKSVNSLLGCFFFNNYLCS